MLTEVGVPIEPTLNGTTNYLEKKLSLASLFLTIVFWSIHWLIVLPISLIIATPYVLVVSLKHPRGYRSAVFKQYRKIFNSFVKFWSEGGFGFTP